MSLIKAWANHFQSNIRMRGRSYQAQGRVHQVPPDSGEWVRAQIQGSNEQTHTVVIRGQGPTAQVHCTCAYFATGQYCKHIWATLLDVHYNGMKHSGEMLSDNGEVSHQVAGMSADNDAPMLAMPKARKREPGATKSAAHEPEWVGRLMLLRSHGLDTPSPVQRHGRRLAPDLLSDQRHRHPAARATGYRTQTAPAHSHRVGTHASMACQSAVPGRSHRQPGSRTHGTDSRRSADSLSGT
ncbi:MAG: hypothetical protein HC898_07885 [Phycisphaerales bacterium]|nr:hypothetical protein [Phycisphaerales bacterium]